MIEIDSEILKYLRENKKKFKLNHINKFYLNYFTIAYNNRKIYYDCIVVFEYPLYVSEKDKKKCNDEVEIINDIVKNFVNYNRLEKLNNIFENEN